MASPMRVLSLCTGIGGIDLACEAASMEIVGQVELDEFCNRVLAHHWPHVQRARDLYEVTGDEWGAIDLVVAGFPCQPASLAGKRRGQDDARWLWPEVARIIRACQPAFVLLENVPGLISLGLDDVLGDLDSAGYEATAVVYPAAAVGTPHERERVFIVGHARALSDADSDRCGDGAHQQVAIAGSGRQANVGVVGSESVAHAESGSGTDAEAGRDALRANSAVRTASRRRGEVLAESNSWGCESRQCDLSSRESDTERCGGGVGILVLAHSAGAGLSFARCAGESTNYAEIGAGVESEPQRCSTGQVESRVGVATHGLPGRLAGHPGWPARPGEAQYEWEAPRTVPASDRTPRRAAKLKALGNAVVPQQVYPILAAIAETWRQMQEVA